MLIPYLPTLLSVLLSHDDLYTTMPVLAILGLDLIDKRLPCHQIRNSPKQYSEVGNLPPLGQIQLRMVLVFLKRYTYTETEYETLCGPQSHRNVLLIPDISLLHFTVAVKYQ